MRLASLLFVLMASVAGCVGAAPADDDVSPCGAAPTEALPERLSASGLYRAAAGGEHCPEVLPYTPAAALWSDGAEKQRFLRLPDGATIDGRDMDHWRFPRGTLLWKEFAKDGVRLETRAALKTGDGDGDWDFAAYRWVPDGSDALLNRAGATNVDGTGWDIPSADDGVCLQCHGNEPGRVIGFSAVLLSHDDQLQHLVDDGLVARAPGPARAAVHAWPEPARAALLSLHVNCGHCHQAGGIGFEGTTSESVPGLATRLRFNDVDAAHADAATTTVGQDLALPLDELGVRARLVPGAPEVSGLYQRLTHRDWMQMPPLGTEVVDDAGAALVAAWIRGLR